MNTDSHKIYLIRIDSPEQSKAFQEKLFKTTDIIWGDGQKTPQYFSEELLVIEYDNNNYRLFIALMPRYELYKISDNYIELSVSEIINSERHPFECVLKLSDKEQAMNQTYKNMYGHPSSWNELPDGVYPVGFRKFRSSLVEPFNYEFNNTMVSTLNTYTVNSYVFTCGECFVMIEFSNGWIWEAGDRGWRHKDGDCDNDCIHCDDDMCIGDCEKEAWSCLDPDESTKPFIIPLREKVYGRDTHAALMAAHRKRQEIRLPDAAHSLIRSLCGDILTHDGVGETK